MMLAVIWEMPKISPAHPLAIEKGSMMARAPSCVACSKQKVKPRRSSTNKQLTGSVTTRYLLSMHTVDGQKQTTGIKTGRWIFQSVNEEEKEREKLNPVFEERGSNAVLFNTRGESNREDTQQRKCRGKKKKSDYIQE